MRFGSNNPLRLVPVLSCAVSRVKIVGALAILGMALLGASVKGQPSAVDPNKSQHQIPKGRAEEGPPPEQETDPRKLVKLNRKESIFASIKESAGVLGGPNAKDEEIAYNYIFKHVNTIPENILEEESLKGPANNKGLAHIDLVGETRDDFLRELIHMEGRLVRIRTMKPTDELEKAGFQVLYEGWFLNKNNPEHTVCVVFSKLPPGVSAGDGLSYDMAVDGYYFKLMRYKSLEKEPGKDKPVERVAPLILARTFRVLDTSSPGWGLGNYFIPAVVGGLLTVTLTVFGLFWWFRRGDRRVQEMTAQALTKKNPFEEDAPSDEMEAGGERNRINPPSPN
jgi:hypothetical protein